MNGLDMARASWRVLMLDKELLVFPLLSGIACVLVMAGFAYPMWASGMLEQLANESQANSEAAESVFSDPALWVVTFAYYFATYYVIVFFNTALISCAMVRFQGGDPTLGDGFRAAMERVPQITGWALVASTVGMLLKGLESRSRGGGRMAAGFLGLAWSAATFFVVPIIVREKVGPFEALKRSIGILKKTWGEALIVNFGLDLITGIALVAVFMLPMGLGVLSQDDATFYVGMGVALLLAVIVVLISQALKAITIGALYEFAEDRVVAPGFEQEALSTAFSPRQSY
jgi:hypothetical protein